MRRHLPICLLAATIVSLGLLPKAHGCAPVMKKGDEVRIASESALIVWDEKTKTEHFIRRANFDTSAAYFGFLVPTPTMPKLSEVPDSTFTMLEQWTKAEVKVETKYVYRSMFGGVTRNDFAVGARAAPEEKGPPPRAAVEVLDRVKVAGLDAVILRATDAEKLRQWLGKHGYDARPALTEWLDWYVKNEWVITAFQFKKENAAAGGLSSNAVRMTFETEKPFYPYREPADARPKNYTGPPRLLKVFFVGTGRFDGTLGADGAWHARTEHSRALTADQAEALTKGINGDRKDDELRTTRASAPEGAWLTEFSDPATPRQGTDEVYFAKSASQDERVRPPIIRYQYVERIHPSEIVFVTVLSAVVLLGGAWIVWRFGMRKD